MINKKYKDVRIAIIGGTGVYDPKLLTDVDQLRVYTPYGSPSDLITVGVYAGTKNSWLYLATLSVRLKEPVFI